jgi:hypothetical protein
MPSGKANRSQITIYQRDPSSLLCEKTVSRVRRPRGPRFRTDPGPPTDDVANFRSYTYWSLVPACFSVTQRLATIFTFLGIFVRIRGGLLHPRIVVWASVTCFAVGYLAWELLDHPHSDSTRRRTNRPCPLLSFSGIIYLLNPLAMLTGRH